MFALVIISIMAIGATAHHNGTCEEEEDSVRTCMRRFFDAKRTTTPQPSGNTSAFQEAAERCFMINGCQRPLFQGQQFEADIERVKVCKQQLRQKMQTTMKECVEKKAPDHVIPAEDDRWHGRDKDEQEKRQHYQRWALGKQTQDITICPVPANGEKVKICLRDVAKRPTEETEKWQKEICDVKRDCVKNISAICQEHMNITRSLKCECARERYPGLTKEFYDCIGLTPLTKDDSQEHWEQHLCKNTCSKD